MLWAERKEARRLESEVKKHLYDLITVRCKDGERHEVYGKFDVREYVDRHFDSHSKVREASIVFSCLDINRLNLTLKKCRFYIESECLGSRWYLAKHVLRHTNNEYLVTLESCDDPEIGRKRAVDWDTCDTAAKFRSRRKVTGLPLRSDRTV